MRQLRSRTPARAIAALLALAVPAVTVPVARAGAGLSDRDKRATARRYVDAGLAAEAAKDYAAAVDFYLRAYDLVPHPLLIFNMGEAHRLAGHHAEALEHFRRYLAADPTGARAGDAAAKLGPVEKAWKAEQARKAEDARRAEEARLAREARLAEEARVLDEARQAEEARLAEEARVAEDARRREQARREEAELALRRATLRAAARRKGERLRLAGLGVGAAGVAGLALGFYFGHRAQDLSGRVSATYDGGQFADGEDAERAQLICLSAGGVATAAGAALVILGWRASSRASRVVVTPTTDTRGATLGLTGAW